MRKRCNPPEKKAADREASIYAYGRPERRRRWKRGCDSRSMSFHGVEKRAIGRCGE